MKKMICVLMAIPLFVRCASIETAVSKRNLEVQNKMSATVYLDPVEDDKDKTIYIQIKNTSDKRDFDLQNDIAGSLVAKGYRLVNKMSQAHYMLQANVLQVGQSSQTAAEAAVYRDMELTEHFWVPEQPRPSERHRRMFSVLAR